MNRIIMKSKVSRDGILYRKEIWQTSAEKLGRKESYSALLKAG